jgi:alkanesulfonate monooxygenase SsuD/methylene tetrahydromethanopterin reductase-like flavin-dependent oxidoreductase (luciferase family)
MKFGTNNISSNRRGNPPSEILREWVATAVEAERLGFWSAWTTEHHFASDASYRPYGLSEDIFPATDYDMAADPFTLLSYLAGKTSTIRLGTAVSILHWDHPVRLAERAALLDALSNGRLEWGVGRGIGFRETHVFNVPTDPGENARKYHEAVEIIRRLWEGGPFSFEGDFYTIPEISITPQPERQPPPLFIGSASNDSAIWAAKNDLPYATITWPLVGMNIYRDKREAYLEAGEQAGNDVARHSTPHFLYTHCAETDEEAAEITEYYMAQFQYILETHYEFERGHEEENSAAGAETSAAYGLANVEKLAKYPVEHQLVGSPETIIERVKEYQAELGIDYIVCNIAFGGMPFETTMKSLKLFGERVIPAFAQEKVASGAAS